MFDKNIKNGSNVHTSSQFSLFPNKTYVNGKWIDSAGLKTFEVF